MTEPRSADFEAYVRDDVRAMEAYTPILPFEVLSEQLGRRPAEIIKLDANENPYGPASAALAALRELSDTVAIYPDPEARRLRAALAAMLGVDAGYILAGAGADELIDLIMRLFVRPGDAVINCPPTFGMYSFDAELNGARVISVPRGADFALDVAGIEQAAAQSGARLLFLCSPNNPDGGLIPPDVLDRLLKLPLVVVLDEAYIEFSGAASAAKRVPDAPNMVVLRTFSKWAGLAGLRIGYGVFPQWMMAHLWKIKQPYNVNVAADAAARASVADRAALLATVDLIIAERSRLYDALAAIPYLAPYPSRSNFVLCRVTPPADAAALKQRLATEYGILIRYFNKPGLRDHVRFSVGRPEQTAALINALQAIGETL